MTSTILFLTLLALLVLLIVAYRGDFAEPSILFVVGFTLAVFNGLTNYRTWDFDLSMQTCFVVGFGTFAFALTAYGVKVFFRSCVGHRTAHREYGEPQDIVLPMWVYVGGLLFTGLALLIVSRQIISLTLPTGETALWTKPSACMTNSTNSAPKAWPSLEFPRYCIWRPTPWPMRGCFSPCAAWCPFVAQRLSCGHQCVGGRSDDVDFRRTQ